MPDRARPVPQVAILSDIHANRHALDAVREEMNRREVTRWWCVGDMVGYGAAPGAVVDCARTTAERCISGNHDLVVTGRLPIDTFASWARDAAEWTAGELDADQTAWLAGCQPVDREDTVTLVHASLRDPVWEYINGPVEAAASLGLASSPITVFGHTHVPAAWREVAHGEITPVPTFGTLTIGPGRWLLNPGSVGQPRDGDPRAAWAIYDPSVGQIEFIRTPYDIAGAQADIRAAGLPELLAARLEEGF